MSRNVTLKDVAAYAGVSVTTVSNVVRNWPYVSPSMRDHVQKAIDELGYSPHLVAQGLRTGHTQALAFIVPDLSNPYFAEIVAAAENVAQTYGYILLVFNSHEDADREVSCVRRATSRSVDGILVTHSLQTLQSEVFWKDEDIPIVAVDRVTEYDEYPVCTVDNLRAGQLATNHLVELGHPRVAHIAGPKRMRTAQDRLDGYLHALNEHDLDYRRVIHSGESWGSRDGYDCMLTLLDDATPPTAVFASNDRIAIGVLHAIYDRGLRVPDDISVVGMDGIEVSAHLTPPLTTIRQPLDRLAGAAVEVLLRLIRGETMGQRIVLLEPELIVRKSTAPFP